jgi:hypothetical protein
MRNLALMGISAVLLFAISAGLSLWLNPPKTEETAKTKKSGEGKKESAESGEERARTPRPVVQPTPTGDVTEAARMSDQLQNDLARVKSREDEVDRQQDMYRFVLEDIRNEMELLQTLWQRAVDRVPVKPDSPPTTAPAPTIPSKDEPKKPSDKIDPKGLGKASGMTDSMPPENAARLVEQLARTGKVDTAAQLLSKMNPRQAAKVLAAIADEKMSMQILEKVLELRAPTPAPPPAAGGP